MASSRGVLSLLLLLVVALVSSCTTIGPEQGASENAAAQSRFAAATGYLDVSVCPWPLAEGEVVGETIDCGYVTVPERHSEPTGRKIRLAVARLRSTQRPSGEPIIYLSGEPGESNASLLSSFNGSVGAKYRERHDVVIFDQRGVGRSQPALDCPEVRDQVTLDYQRLLPAKQDAENWRSALLQCRDRLEAQGIDLSAYNTSESAADVDAIRVALGYRKVNLLGVSYGSSVALAVMRDFSDSVRSAVLDSVLKSPIDRISSSTADVARALDLNFSACVQSTACKVDVPTLHAHLAKVFEDLNRQAATVSFVDSRGVPRTAIVTGTRLVNLIQIGLGSPNLIGAVPALIEQLNQGNTVLLREYVLHSYERLYAGSQAARYTVLCGDADRGAEASSDVGALAYVPKPLRETNSVTLAAFAAVCAEWPAKAPKPNDGQPVSSEVPTLILASQNDPLAPPANGQLAAATLPQSKYVEVAGIGHGVTVNGYDCAAQMVVDFLSNPGEKPDTTCSGVFGVGFMRAP